MLDRHTPTRHSLRYAVLLLVAACFTGDGLAGQPCVTDKDCNPVADLVGDSLRCVHDICGYSPQCGDGILDIPGGEQCDDDNRIDGDDCSSSCMHEKCGDGTIQVQEECDDGNQVDGDRCSASCRFEKCGNGVVDPKEKCDDGNQDNIDACLDTCEEASCGDGSVRAGVEQCDDGNLADNDNCSSDCKHEHCGDGVKQAQEACDDGNQIDGDGCSMACAFETCGDGVTQGQEECDDGNNIISDACIGCLNARCDDSVTWQGVEQCDDGDPDNTDGCLDTCQKASCGDGSIQAGVEPCDDGNMSDFDKCTNMCTYSPETPELKLSFSQVKKFEFSWAPVVGATYYQLEESVDGNVPFEKIGPDIMGESIALTMPLRFRLDASYRLRACNGDGCSTSAVVEVVGSLAEAVGYFKASNTDAGDYFGTSVALSSDGNTLAVGAFHESSSATGIDGEQANNATSWSGAVYVFVREGGTWSQQAYVKASNAGHSDEFGGSVALSGDGNTLAVGASGEKSNATGIGGDQANNDAQSSGAVYVFVRNGVVWSQQAYVKASNTDAEDRFGARVALAGDGDTLAVGASGERSKATGIDGNQANNDAGSSGAVYVFVRDSDVWSQQAYVKASNTGASDFFGTSVALSDNGDTLAVGAYGEDSDATGIGGDQANNAAQSSGAVYVFVRNGGVWSQQAYVKASNTGANDGFAQCALSGDGDTLAVGAPREGSNATGIGGDQANNDAQSSGAVYVFVRNGGAWSQQAYVKASNTGANDNFGGSLDLLDDGDTLAVGASGEKSNATGIGSDQANDNEPGSGAVYVFVRGGGLWSQQTYVKASNPDADDAFGRSVALSGDGGTLAVGAPGEDSTANGISGDQANNAAEGCGAVYLY